MRCGLVLLCLCFVGCGASPTPPQPPALHPLPTTTVLSVNPPTPVVATSSPTPIAQSTQPVASTTGILTSPTPTTARVHVVSVMPSAGADIREQPDPASRVIAHVPPDQELAMLN